jgi:putative hemolysin
MSWFYFEVFVLLGLVLLDAFFSAAEVAYTGLTPGQLKQARAALHLWEMAPDKVLATLLLSSNAVNTAVGVVAASLTLHLSMADGWRKSLLTLALSFTFGLILLVFGEIIPKIIAKQRPLLLAVYMAPLITILTKLVSPLSRMAIATTDFLFFGYQKHQAPSFSFDEAELKNIFTHSSIPYGSRRILDQVMEFSQARVRNVMIPASEIFAVSADEPLPQLVARIVRSGLSRVPVYSKSLNNLIGVIYSKDLLITWRSGALIVLEDILRPVYYVEDSLPMSDLLRRFRTGRHHLAIVVPSPGSRHVKGLVTLQDALEAIVGDIREEV